MSFNAGKPVEDAHDDEAQQVQPRVHAEAVYRSVQPALEQGTDESLGRPLRVQVYGRAQGLGGFEYGPIFRVVGVLATHMAVVDDGLEAQRVAALDFLGRPRGVLRGNRGHADEALGMTATGGCQLIVGIACERLGLGGSEHMRA